MEVLIGNPGIHQVAYFQSIGGFETVATVWDNIGYWLDVKKIDYRKRRFAGYFQPQPSATNPLLGYVASMLLDDKEGTNGSFEEVPIVSYDTSGLYAYVISNRDNMKGAWDALAAFAKNSEYTFDLEKGRPYFEEYLFKGRDFNEPPVDIKIWMPVKKK